MVHNFSFPSILFPSFLFRHFIFFEPLIQGRCVGSVRCQALFCALFFLPVGSTRLGYVSPLLCAMFLYSGPVPWTPLPSLRISNFIIIFLFVWYFYGTRNALATPPPFAKRLKSWIFTFSPFQCQNGGNEIGKRIIYRYLRNNKSEERKSVRRDFYVGLSSARTRQMQNCT